MLGAGDPLEMDNWSLRPSVITVVMGDAQVAVGGRDAPAEI